METTCERLEAFYRNGMSIERTDSQRKLSIHQTVHGTFRTNRFSRRAPRVIKSLDEIAMTKNDLAGPSKVQRFGLEDTVHRVSSSNVDDDFDDINGL